MIKKKKRKEKERKKERKKRENCLERAHYGCLWNGGDYRGSMQTTSLIICGEMNK